MIGDGDAIWNAALLLGRRKKAHNIQFVSTPTHLELNLDKIPAKKTIKYRLLAFLDFDLVFGYERLSVPNHPFSIFIHFVVKLPTGSRMDKCLLSLCSESDCCRLEDELKRRIKPQLPRRYAVVLNPKGGQKKGRQLYFRIVAPMLGIAGIQVELRPTRYAKHAVLIAHDLDLGGCTGIIAVGGDGVVHEVLNGLMKRPDWKKAMDTPVGIIPTGSFNGLCHSLGIDDPVWAALAIIKGRIQPFDVMCLVQDGRRFFAHSLFLWGLLADSNSPISVLGRLFHLRTYNCRLKIVKSSQPDDDSQQLSNLLSLVVAKHPWLSPKMMLSPKVNPADGNLYVFVTTCEPSQRLSMRRRILEAARSNDDFLVVDDLGLTDMFVASALHIQVVEEPNLLKRDGDGKFSIDGEAIPSKSIHIECLSSLLNLYVPTYNGWASKQQTLQK